MKKLFALLLAAMMVMSLFAACAPADTGTTTAAAGDTTAAAGDTTAAAVSGDVTEVVYYCSIGAYLATLQEEINKWNQGEGKEAGVYIKLESNINTYSTDLEALMQAGTHFDLIDAGTGNAHWKTQGWVQDLSVIENDELKAIIDGYEEYLVNGINYQKDGNGEDILFALPLEVVPIKMTVNADIFAANELELPETWDDVIEAAKIITENGGGEVFGYGGTTWSAMWRRLHMKAFSSSTEKMWWDPNTATYSFSQYKEIIEGLAEMQANGWMYGLDDMAIDPIRSAFSEGKVAMFVAPSYDFGVYTSQFVIDDAFEWTVIDVPVVDADATEYKGVYLDRVGCSIDAVAYENADETKKEAIVKAFCFLNSDELNAAIYANGGMIPYKADLIANTEVLVEQPQWAQFGDIADYTSCVLYPDAVIPLEGDNYATVFSAIVHGELEWTDELIADLEQRYNDAYAAAKADPDIDTSIYEYTYDRSK